MHESHSHRSPLPSLPALYPVRAQDAALALLLLVALGAALYLPAFGAERFNDDYQHVYTDPASQIFYYFTHPVNIGLSYRPLNGTAMAILQMLFDKATWPIHALQLAMHVALCWMLYLFMRGEGFRPVQAWLAGGFMLVAQVAVQPIIGNDSLPQTGGAFFGYLALLLLYRSGLAADRGPRPLRWLLSLGAFGLALLMKENSVSFLILIGLLIAWRCLRPADWLNVRSALRAAGIALPYLVVFAVYYLMRSASGSVSPTFSSASQVYGLSLGLNIPVNVTLLLFASLLPLSTADVFIATQTGHLLLPALAAALTGALALVTLAGIWASRRRGFALGLAAGGLLSLAPLALLNRVSELYAYNTLPLVAALVGIGLGQVIAAGGRWRMAAAAFAVVALALNGAAVVSKAGQMRALGERAQRLMRSVESFLPQVPPDGTLYLLNRPGVPEYSVFVANDFHLMDEGAELYLIKRADREDVRVVIMSRPASAEALAPAGTCLALVSPDGQTAQIAEDNHALCPPG